MYWLVRRFNSEQYNHEMKEYFKPSKRVEAKSKEIAKNAKVINYDIWVKGEVPNREYIFASTTPQKLG